jgi:hypothetical protein
MPNRPAETDRVPGRTYCDRCGHTDFVHYEVDDETEDETLRFCEVEFCGCETWVLPE